MAANSGKVLHDVLLKLDPHSHVTHLCDANSGTIEQIFKCVTICMLMCELWMQPNFSLAYPNSVNIIVSIKKKLIYIESAVPNGDHTTNCFKWNENKFENEMHRLFLCFSLNRYLIPFLF